MLSRLGLLMLQDQGPHFESPWGLWRCLTFKAGEGDWYVPESSAFAGSLWLGRVLLGLTGTGSLTGGGPLPRCLRGLGLATLGPAGLQPVS